MRWIDLAKLLIPIAGAVIPKAAPLVPAILVAVDEAQRAHPDSDEAREVKRAHVINSVAASAEIASRLGPVAISPAQAITIAQAVFQIVDTTHAIAKAQRVDDPPAPAPQP
ncbi:MAG: hypothetical protein LC750_16765 [Actinobacteria bacterium]|nr:hypothetical protein [Actinomycetota bacterium]